MKRFWLVLLSLGLIMAFSASAFAVDVKVSGEYYAAGMYLDKVSVNGGHGGTVTNPSTAFYFQRLRVGTDFVVAPSLKLVTRFDAMERIWGGGRSVRLGDVTGIPGSTGTNNLDAAANSLDSQNIAFEIGYIDYTSPIGLVQVGYMENYVWGTIFGNKATGPTAGQIKLTVPVGPVYLFAGYAKEEDRSSSAYFPIADYISGSPSSTRTDRDLDSYRLAVFYKQANIEGGALLLYNRDATSRGIGAGPFMRETYAITPYFKAKMGKVALQGELTYGFGDFVKMEYGIPNSNISVSTLSVFLDGTVDLGMVNVGGSFAYLSGDDNPLDSTLKGNANTAGLDWNPCLIMFNNDVVTKWVGGVAGHDGSQVGGAMSNAWFGQGRVGVKATPALDINASLSYAVSDKKGVHMTPPTFDNYTGGAYGWEVDVTGTYKITNNLSYMLGVGYLFTGDYYKGVDDGSSKINDDYMLINKLTLNF